MHNIDVTTSVQVNLPIDCDGIYLQVCLICLGHNNPQVDCLNGRLKNNHVIRWNVDLSNISKVVTVLRREENHRNDPPHNCCANHGRGTDVNLPDSGQCIEVELKIFLPV
jgi:hypothetical protein